jgi:hypothetical protein
MTECRLACLGFKSHVGQAESSKAKFEDLSLH